MRADKHTKPSGSAAKRVLKGVGKVLGTMVLVLFLTTLIFACLFALYVKNDLSAQVDSIDGFTLDQTSVIYYEDPKTGQDVVLRKLYGGANRTWVEYENIPKNLIHACIAIEDKRFEDHQGVDWFTTMKACVKMFLGQGEAGGSTITQQLVKNITGRAASWWKFSARWSWKRNIRKSRSWSCISTSSRWAKTARAWSLRRRSISARA